MMVSPLTFGVMVTTVSSTTLMKSRILTSMDSLKLTPLAPLWIAQFAPLPQSNRRS